MISLIVAVAKNNVIGRAGDLPWYLPDDLKYFKKLTTDKTVIMGRMTYDSIIMRIGKPLPNRRNIVLTRDAGFKGAVGVEVMHSISEVVRAAENDDTFVIGGAHIYEQVLPFADTIYLTEVGASVQGDVFFPDLDPAVWQETKREAHTRDEKNLYDYSFVVLKRRD